MSHSGPREHAPRTMHTSGQQCFQSPQLGGPSGRLYSKAILRRLSGTSTEEGGKTQTTFCLQPYKGALAEWERERCPAGVCVHAYRRALGGVRLHAWHEQQSPEHFLQRQCGLE